MVTPVVGVGTVLVLVALTLFSAEFLIVTGAMEPALLLTFLFALFRMLPLVQEMNNTRALVAVNRPALSAVTELLSTEGKPVLRNGSTVPGVLEDAIEFRNVCFEYEPGTPVLTDISCTFRVGKTTAIVGGSGAGKTTVADLIARFYDPASGSIHYDGQDLRDLEIAGLRRQISMVTQETHLFHDTIGANISYGAPGASEEEIRRAAERANILEFIDSLADGLDTLTGDNGVRLSGGQKQRIAIARAMIRSSNLLILDEATSALDSVSEKLVQSAIERAMENRTVIVIAHRLSTVEKADWVIVLEDGKLVEQGTFDDLIEKKGRLWQYYSLQSMAGETPPEPLRIVRSRS
jgi:subfamily B ATP-binding cassette protein MsbA